MLSSTCRGHSGYPDDQFQWASMVEEKSEALKKDGKLQVLGASNEEEDVTAVQHAIGDGSLMITSDEDRHGLRKAVSKPSLGLDDANAMSDHENRRAQTDGRLNPSGNRSDIDRKGVEVPNDRDLETDALAEDPRVATDADKALRLGESFIPSSPLTSKKILDSAMEIQGEKFNSDTNEPISIRRSSLSKAESRSSELVGLQAYSATDVDLNALTPEVIQKCSFSDLGANGKTPCDQSFNDVLGVKNSVKQTKHIERDEGPLPKNRKEDSEEQFLLTSHNRTDFDSDLVLNPALFPGLQVGDYVEIFHPGAEKNAIMLQVTSLEPPRGNIQISLLKSITTNPAFALRTFQPVVVRKTSATQHALTYVEVSFKDQYISQGEFWLFVDRMRGKSCFIGQKVSIGGMNTSMDEMLDSKNSPVSWGVITDSTKFVFRSCSARVFWLVQLSKEMWDFSENGSIYFELFLNCFARDVYNEWNARGLTHQLTILYFSRSYYNERPPSDQRGVYQDYDGRYYSDIYHAVVHDWTFVDWSTLRAILKEAFHKFPSIAGWSVPSNEVGVHDEAKRVSDSDTVNEAHDSCCAMPSTSREGNCLEAVNLALNIFDKHFMDRDLARTGQAMVLITPGPGVFEVDRKLTKITKQRMMDNAIGCDFVSLTQAPLHIAPLFIYKPSMSRLDTLSSPHPFANPRSYRLPFSPMPILSFGSSGLENGAARSASLDVTERKQSFEDGILAMDSQPVLSPALNGFQDIAREVSLLCHDEVDVANEPLTNGVLDVYNIPHWVHLSFPYHRCLRRSGVNALGVDRLSPFHSEHSSIGKTNSEPFQPVPFNKMFDLSNPHRSCAPFQLVNELRWTSNEIDQRNSVHTVPTRSTMSPWYPKVHDCGLGTSRVVCEGTPSNSPKKESWRKQRSTVSSRKLVHDEVFHSSSSMLSMVPTITAAPPLHRYRSFNDLPALASTHSGAADADTPAYDESVSGTNRRSPKIRPKIIASMSGNIKPPLLDYPQASTVDKDEHASPQEVVSPKLAGEATLQRYHESMTSQQLHTFAKEKKDRWMERLVVKIEKAMEHDRSVFKFPTKSSDFSMHQLPNRIKKSSNSMDVFCGGSRIPSFHSCQSGEGYGPLSVSGGSGMHNKLRHGVLQLSGNAPAHHGLGLSDKETDIDEPGNRKGDLGGNILSHLKSSHRSIQKPLIGRSKSVVASHSDESFRNEAFSQKAFIGNETNSAEEKKQKLSVHMNPLNRQKKDFAAVQPFLQIGSSSSTNSFASWNQRNNLATNPFDWEGHMSTFLERVTHNRRRWSHLFPGGFFSREFDKRLQHQPCTKECGDCFDDDSTETTPLTIESYHLNWKSLCMPGILPLTTDYFPDDVDQDNYFKVNFYNLTLPDTGSGGYEDHEDLIEEMVCQRLSQDFQLFISTAKKEPKEITTGFKPSNPLVGVGCQSASVPVPFEAGVTAQANSNSQSLSLSPLACASELEISEPDLSSNQKMIHEQSRDPRHPEFTTSPGFQVAGRALATLKSSPKASLLSVRRPLSNTITIRARNERSGPERVPRQRMRPFTLRNVGLPTHQRSKIQNPPSTTVSTVSGTLHAQKQPVYTYILTMGHELHRLSYVPLTREVRVQQSRHLSRYEEANTEWKYEYMFFDRIENRNLPVKITFTQNVKHFNWNSFDYIVCGYEDDFRSTARYRRNMFSIVPGNMRNQKGRSSTSRAQRKSMSSALARQALLNSAISPSNGSTEKRGVEYVDSDAGMTPTEFAAKTEPSASVSRPQNAGCDLNIQTSNERVSLDLESQSLGIDYGCMEQEVLAISSFQRFHEWLQAKISEPLDIEYRRRYNKKVCGKLLEGETQENSEILIDEDLSVLDGISQPKKFIRAKVKLHSQRSQRYEWLTLQCDRVYTPYQTFHLEIQWMVAAGSSVQNFVAAMSRKAKQVGLDWMQTPEYCRSTAFNYRHSGGRVPHPFIIPKCIKFSKPFSEATGLVRLIVNALQTRVDYALDEPIKYKDMKGEWPILVSRDGVGYVFFRANHLEFIPNHMHLCTGSEDEKLEKVKSVFEKTKKVCEELDICNSVLSTIISKVILGS